MKEKTLKTGSGTGMKMGTAIVLTDGSLGTNDAKTAHGLIRGTERFDILGVIDSRQAGRDAGEVLDGVKRNIPVFPTVDDFLKTTGGKADYCIVGVALSGGRLDEYWQEMLLDAMAMGLSIINGMHMLLGDDPVFIEAARTHGVQVIDIRRPKRFDELHFWTGRIFDMKIPRLAMLGTDCAIGKRTTTRLIMEALKKEGVSTEMIYTGQTGWLEGNRHGFIFDATLNDFVSGELEAAIVECEQISSPDLILIEGQSGLRNPSGPCGTEIILSGNTKGVILQHAPFITLSGCNDTFGFCRPDLKSEIELIEMYRTRVLAVTLNNQGGSPEELADYAEKMRAKTGLPVIRPLEDGMSALLPIVHEFMQHHDRMPETTPLKPSSPGNRRI